MTLQLENRQFIPLLFVLCIGTDGRRRAPWGSGIRANTSAWRISRTGRTCKAWHLFFNKHRLEWICIWLISRLHTCVRAGVSFQIKGVVEAFATEGAEVAFDVRMAFHVPIQEPLQGETLGAESAGEFGRIVGISAVDGSRGTRRRIGSAASFARLVLRPRWRIRFGSVASRVLVIVVVHQRVLDAVTAIDEF